MERYCPPGGLVVDPFAGSGIAAFEAVKLGRKAVALDLNPLSSFIIEVTASKYDEALFLATATRIRQEAQSDEFYRRHFSRTRNGVCSTVLNYRWERDRVVGVALETDDETRSLTQADEDDAALAAELDAVTIPAWYPTRKLPRHPSITQRFVLDAGGDTIDHLWTKRNLHVLAGLFEAISRVANSDVRLQLLSAFVQTLHLCTKMVIPRNEAANRDFSGSWGRPDYLIRRRRMEQNPVDVFWRACSGRQGIMAMMRDAVATFPGGISINDLRVSKRIRKSADINYGTADVADLLDYVPAGTADFIITDPPYAGLIRYLPLSVVWLAWLEHVDKKYTPDLEAEISVERNSASSRTNYQRRLRNAFERIHSALTDKGRLVVTFHHQDVREFNDFVMAAKGAGFDFDKVTHQYNRRSGESNVANPYGVSASDFYVRCVKHRDPRFAPDASDLERYVVAQAVSIVGRRNEPTPFTFLFQSLWPELLQAGFVQPQDSRDEITRILMQHEGPDKTFTRYPNPDPNVGDLWWFNRPSDYISYPDRPLQDRIADSVVAYLRRHSAAKLDDIIANLFREYPNGLTPDPRKIGTILEKIAFRSQGKWRLAPEALTAITQHSNSIATILRLGRRLGVRRFVGRREQPEQVSETQRLRDLADVTTLQGLRGRFPQESIERLEMVDAIFLPAQGSDELLCLWEVENSTNFGSAIQRGSNAPASVPKIMVVPDAREAELKRTVDPLFKTSFADNQWRYLTYTDLERAASFTAKSLEQALSTSKSLSGA
ncbi:hypothetical protein [Mesorhizobium sp. M0895]|uniref:hypothetical protein n=1 Tax=Mesorhizobium sp. M0895 TaxID=2957019 RepID=UPI00333B9123